MKYDPNAIVVCLIKAGNYMIEIALDKKKLKAGIKYPVSLCTCDKTVCNVRELELTTDGVEHRWFKSSEWDSFIESNAKW